MQDGLGYAIMETSGNGRRLHLTQEVLHDSPDQVCGTDLKAVGCTLERHAEGVCLRGVGQLLKLDGGLAFAGDRVAYSQQCGDGIEQPALEVRGTSTPARAILSTLCHCVACRRITCSAGGWWPKASSRYTTAMRHGSLMAATPPGDRRQVTKSLKVRQVRHEELPALQCAVSAVA